MHAAPWPNVDLRPARRNFIDGRRSYPRISAPCVTADSAQAHVAWNLPLLAAAFGAEVRYEERSSGRNL